MSKYEFVATHAVQFLDAETGDAWAVFERARELDTPRGHARYRFGTDDAKIAARLRSDLNEHGISEVKPPPPVSKD